MPPIAPPPIKAATTRSGWTMTLVLRSFGFIIFPSTNKRTASAIAPAISLPHAMDGMHTSARVRYPTTGPTYGIRLPHPVRTPTTMPFGTPMMTMIRVVRIPMIDASRNCPLM